MYAETDRAKNSSPGQGLPTVPYVSMARADAPLSVNHHQSAATLISFLIRGLELFVLNSRSMGRRQL
jgi:hypothetical protein